MKKLLLFVVFLSILWACGDALGDGAYRSGCSAGFSNCTFQGTSIFLGPTNFLNPCATNFTRVDGRRCFRSSGGTTSTAINATCTAIPLNTSYGIPAGAKTIRMRIDGSLASGTAAGVEQVLVYFYSDSGCTLFLPGDGYSVAFIWSYYFNDLTAGHTGSYYQQSGSFFVNGQTTIYAIAVKTLVTGGSAGASVLEVPEYSD